MEQAITRASRLLVLGGIAAIIFGVVALVWPGLTLLALVLLFGAFSLVFGAFSFISALDLATEHARHWVPMAFGGLFGMAIGVLTFFRPGITGLALVYLIAVWAIFTGILEFVTGVQLTGQVKSAWALALGGILSVAFGVLVALYPSSGALAIAWLIGIYAILYGATRIYFAYRINKEKDEVKAFFKPFAPGATSSTATSREPTTAGTR